jgi:hypothetical protein
MAVTIAKVQLSASVNGRSIKVAATGSPGTTIHTADSTAIDVLYLWAYNGDTVDRLVTIQFGGTSTPDDDVKFTVPFQTGALIMIPGWTLTNSLVVKAYAAATNVVTINGYVNRIS